MMNAITRIDETVWMVVLLAALFLPSTRTLCYTTTCLRETGKVTL